MATNAKPEILLVNDDGYTSAYLERFARALLEVAKVYVVAPKTEQSGVSHSFQGFAGHSLEKIPGKIPADFYALDGSPADCSKFGLQELFKDRPIECVFSGPNHGENAGVSSLYSGTVAGAREAALWGVPAVALSLCFGATSVMENEAARFAQKIIEERLYRTMPAHSFWNVNFPDEKKVPFAGYRVARQSVSMFTDHYEKKDGKFFLDGCKLPETFAANSDDLALHRGYASITPMTVDQTLESDLSPLFRLVQQNF